MGARKYRDIEIRGTVFPTLAAAAQHFGVQSQTVYKAMLAGRLDTLGSHYTGVEPCPVRIRDKTFTSAKEAALAFGVNTNSIRTALHRGKIDRVGLPPQNARNGAKPFALAGHTWPSRRAAEQDLGLGEGFITHAIRHNRRSSWENIVRAGMAWVDAGRPTTLSSVSDAGKPAREGATWTVRRAA